MSLKVIDWNKIKNKEILTAKEESLSTLSKLKAMLHDKQYFISVTEDNEYSMMKLLFGSTFSYESNLFGGNYRMCPIVFYNIRIEDSGINYNYNNDRDALKDTRESGRVQILYQNIIKNGIICPQNVKDLYNL